MMQPTCIYNGYIMLQSSDHNLQPSQPDSNKVKGESQIHLTAVVIHLMTALQMVMKLDTVT